MEYKNVSTPSRLEYIKLQHLFSDVHEDECFVGGSSSPLSEFDPLTYESYCGYACLHIAARRSDFEAVTLLVRGGVDLSAQIDNDYSQLDCALAQNNGDVVSFLIEHGATPNYKGSVRQWIKDSVQ